MVERTNDSDQPEQILAPGDADTYAAMAEREQLGEGPCEDRDPAAGEITDQDGEE